MLVIEEKRRAERIPLEAPVLLANGSGVSRDMSESGIYFVTDQHLAPGSVVNLKVHLDFICPDKRVQFDCQIEVLRVEKAGDKFGVAASLAECWYVN